MLKVTELAYVGAGIQTVWLHSPESPGFICMVSFVYIGCREQSGGLTWEGSKDC